MQQCVTVNVWEKDTIGGSLQGLTRSSEFGLLAQGQKVHCSGTRQLRRGLRQKDRPVTSLRHQIVS